MEALLVVLRPKPQMSVVADFRPKTYDILLTDLRLSQTDKAKPLKQLPKTTISYEQEPTEALLTYLYVITGADRGGLKGKRAVFVPPAKKEPVGDKDNHVKGTLYCVPIEIREKLNPVFVDHVPNTPGFYSLDLVLDSLNSANFNYSKQTRVMLNRLESWLREKHNSPGAVDLLFSASAEHRIKYSLTNPAYQTDSRGSQNISEYSRSSANEALAKMMAIEKCDITIINPLFGSGLPYKNKVDLSLVNKYWGFGKPDYNKISGGSKVNSDLPGGTTWVDDYPLHKLAYEGDAKGMKDLLKKGYPVTKKDKDSWAPIHYAAWYGHFEAITVLLNEGGCSPNIPNDNGSTPLHFAAANGHPYVVELLLNHPEIDVNALDRYNKTALSLCEGVDKPDWKACGELLTRATKQPSPKIQVFTMDGRYRMLNLLSGANTTVQQLHQQMMRELDIPDSCLHLFTIWICSRNLQLQLKPDHKPIQHLNDWRRKIVGMLTDQDPQREDPQLYLRRDAMLSIADERKVKHFTAISLLFHEAYHNYIKSLYPCADQDAIILGGILMQLYQGDFEPRKASNYFSNDRSLHTLVPVAKLRNKNINWSSKIQTQYKHYSESQANRDRSPQVLQQHFLTLCWNLTVYGAAFFTGYVHIRSSKTPTTVYIGVNDIGVHIIHGHNKLMLQSFSYKDVDWGPRNDRPILEIKLKGSSKGGMCVMTKQKMMQTLTYKEIDWKAPMEKPVVELRLRNNSGKQTVVPILSKQAGLINHLMTKLSQVTGTS